MKLCFVPKQFNPTHRRILEDAQQICEEFSDQGYELTLRQLYYQFIGRDLFPEEWLVNLKSGGATKNHERNYKKLGSILSDARRAGLISWTSIVDRTREPESRYHWHTVGDLLNATAPAFTVDYWTRQSVVPEVWVEKDALIDVVGQVARGYDTLYFSTRGYPSDSALFEAAERIKDRFDTTGKPTCILHFADHDPSGVDMTRAVLDNLRMMECDEEMVWVQRRALMLDQTTGLPPSPAKSTDSRTPAYEARFDTKNAWELDAITPPKLARWVEQAIEGFIDDWEGWEERKEFEQEGRRTLRELAKKYDE